MIALDTNILARYLLDDEPAQARAARRLLADALHLVLSGKAERFVTFDEALVKQARKLDVYPPVTAP